MLIFICILLFTCIAIFIACPSALYFHLLFTFHNISPCYYLLPHSQLVYLVCFYIVLLSSTEKPEVVTGVDTTINGGPAVTTEGRPFTIQRSLLKKTTLKICLSGKSYENYIWGIYFVIHNNIMLINRRNIGGAIIVGTCIHTGFTFTPT